jgi:hypothetical protein
MKPSPPDHRSFISPWIHPPSRRHSRPKHSSLPSPLCSLLSFTLTLSALYHTLHEPSRLCGKKYTPPFTSLITRQVQVQKHFFSPLIRNGSNFAQPLWQQPVHDACARKSQDPQPHRIHSSTVSLLRLHAIPREHTIDIKLGNVIQ